MKAARAGPHYQVAVIGGGTMGLAAAWQLARRGVRVAAFDRWRAPHLFGSHGGYTRIYRQAYAEGAAYVPLALAAADGWAELEAATGQRLLHWTGGLDIALPGFPQARRAAGACETHGLPYQWLSGQEAVRRWPALRLPPEAEVCFSPRAGVLEVEPALQALAGEAERAGATLYAYHPVTALEPTADGWQVLTPYGTYAAERLVVTAGAWAARLLQPLGLHLPLTVQRQVTAWLGPAEPTLFGCQHFPIFLCEGPQGSFYGLPLCPGAGPHGVKVARHGGGPAVDPEAVDRRASPEEVADVLAWVGQHLPALGRQVVATSVCLYTMTPDSHFLIDRHPVWPQVVIGAGFSGHGFKFAPAIGQLLADLVLTGQSSLPRALFRCDRWAAPPA